MNVGVTSAGEGRLTYWRTRQHDRLVEVVSCWLVGRDGPSRGRGQLRRGRVLEVTKTVLTHVARALRGLEETQQIKQTRFLIGPPEEYVHGHTPSIMLTQITNLFPSFESTTK